MSFANARMYAVSPAAAVAWRTLLEAIVERAGAAMRWEDYPAPAPLDTLWHRQDMGAVFMCGLPFSRARPQPALIAAPVPSPEAFAGQPRYWSEFVVRIDGPISSVEGAFGGRLALTLSDSQSGCLAALAHFQSIAAHLPLFSAVIAPAVTPLGALHAVIDDEADIAPIDAYALRLLERYRPELTARVRVVGRTPPTPIPALVSSAAATAELQRAFLTAHREPELQALMEPLLLERFDRPSTESYAQLDERAAQAIAFWRAHRLAPVVHRDFGLI